MNDRLGSQRIEFVSDGNTLRITDALEGAELSFRADREIECQPALPDLFPFPVDAAVSFEAESLSIPTYSWISVRNVDGDHIADLHDSMDLRRGTYYVELSGLTKVYLRIADVELETTGTVESGPVTLTFDRPRTVAVGSRSLHTQPEATITVPEDPTALAEAVSVLGSSIKEFSPERSWPTLRGYPPRIERGAELDIPSPLMPPETGVEVAVRPTYEDIYRLSTLSFYLGARMVISDTPEIRLANGYTEPLPTDGAKLEARVEDLLATWFFLDTLSRAEGYVPSDRKEYRKVGPELTFYPPNLADCSMTERLMEYLEVCPDTVSEYVPNWPTKAVLQPVPEAMELLPHLAHVLSPIRIGKTTSPDDSNAPIGIGTSSWLSSDDLLLNRDDTPPTSGASVLTPEAYENRFNRQITSRGEIQVAVLTNDYTKARTLQTLLSDPVHSTDLGSVDVYESPDTATVTRVLSDTQLDIVYCGLPVDGEQIITNDGIVEASALSGAPAVAIFDNTTSSGLNNAVIENGGLASVYTDFAVDNRAILQLIRLLAYGATIAVSLTLTGITTRGRVWAYGDLSAVIASGQNHILVFTLHAMSPTEFTGSRSGVLTLCSRIGTEQSEVWNQRENLTSLSGTSAEISSVLSAVQVTDLLSEPDTIINIDGTVLLRPEEFDSMEFAQPDGNTTGNSRDGDSTGADQ